MMATSFQQVSPQSNVAAADGPPAVTRLSARGVRKSYHKGDTEIPVLRGVDLDVGEREFVAIVGQSGSGKSTLLHVLGTLDAADGGEIRVDGQRVDNASARRRDELRNRTFGMVFQAYHLLPELTTLENVLTPLMIRLSAWDFWRQRRDFHRRAEELLDLVGLSHRLRHRPGELSGGEMQRASIARALVAEPRILLADEPTGNLDPQTGAEIVELLRTLNRSCRLTIVMVTHDTANAARARSIGAAGRWSG
ncbi:MAG: ABC transporter ATP-binding protein [Pirellulales bacterium]